MDALPLDALPLPTVVIEGDLVAQANRAFAALLGLAGAEAAVGRRYADFVAPEDRGRVADRQRRRLAGEAVPGVYEATLCGAAGRVPVEIRVTLHGARWVAQLVDKRGDVRRRELLQSLARLGASVQRELSGEAIADRLREGLLALDIRSAWLEPVPGGLRVRWARGGPDEEPALLAPLEAALGEPLVGLTRPFGPLSEQAWREGAVFADDLVSEAARWFGAPASDLLRGAPVGGFGRAIGVRVDVAGAPAALLFAAGGWLRPDDLAAFQLFGSQVGAALEAARRVSELTLLNDIAVASGALDPVLLLDNALRRIASTLHAPVAGAYLWAGSQIVPAALLGVAREDIEAAPGGLGASLAQRAAQQKSPVREPASEFEGDRRRWFRERLGVEEFLGVPLLAKDRVLGSLVLGRPAGQPFEDGEVRLLAAVGVQLGMAVENARLFADTRRRIGDLEAVNSLALRVFSTAPGDADRLLEASCREIAEALEAEAAVVLRVDGDGRRLVGVAGWGVPLSPDRIAFELDQAPLAAQALRSQEPVWAPEVVLADGLRAPATGARSPTLAMLFVPLVSRSATRGLVAVADRPTRRFGEAEVALAYALASEAAMGLENAELYAAERRRVDELSRLNEENARLYEDLRRSYAELARAQEQLIHQERLAAIGQLAAVVAHEVRNPLAVIFNSLGTLRRLVQPQGDARMLFDIVGEEADRLNRIVGDLLDFARPSTPRLAAEPLDRVLDDAAAAALAGAAGRVRLVREVAGDLPPVLMDAHLMRQAVLNVMVNAVQAMPDGGSLTVRARVEGAALVRLEIEDTGAGIPEEIRHRIFEPFFTTRPTGTGLGLAVVKRIVEDHAAAVTVETVEPCGTRFVLLLPADGPATEVENVEPLWSR